jgi:tetratricopeptide (TPR) repeat protein
VPLWVARGDFARVTAHLEQVTLRHPRYAFGWYSLAYAYRRLDRPGTAVAAYEAYIDLRPGDAEPYFGLGAAHTEAGNPAAAVAAYRRYVELERDPDRARYVERAGAEIRRLGGEPPEAVAPSPSPSIVWLQQARAAAARGRLARAVAAAGRALALAFSAGA